jgi:hypothetical protein
MQIIINNYYNANNLQYNEGYEGLVIGKREIVIYTPSTKDENEFSL